MKRGSGPLAVAGLLGFSAVAFGAFGAHSLRARLSPQALEIYRTAALYHLVHAVAALAVALGAEKLRRWRLILALYTEGVVLFAGSLYALAITGIGVFGAITPLGGLLLLAAWALVALEALGASKDAA